MPKEIIEELQDRMGEILPKPVTAKMLTAAKTIERIANEQTELRPWDLKWNAVAGYAAALVKELTGQPPTRSAVQVPNENGKGVTAAALDLIEPESLPLRGPNSLF